MGIGVYFADKKLQFEKNVKQEILDLVDSIEQHKREPLTIEEYESLLPLNSYDRHLLYPCLNYDALVTIIYKYLNQSSIKHLGKYEMGTTYDEVIIKVLYPILLLRAKEMCRLSSIVQKANIAQIQSDRELIEGELKRMDSFTKEGIFNYRNTNYPNGKYDTIFLEIIMEYKL